jgi:hypothetical protein
MLDNIRTSTTYETIEVRIIAMTLKNNQFPLPKPSEPIAEVANGMLQMPEPIAEVNTAFSRFSRKGKVFSPKWA